MKAIKIFMTTALLTIAVPTVFAQESSSSESQKSDSTKVYNNLVSRTNGVWNLNFLSISTDDFNPETRHSHSHHYADLGIQDIALSYAGIANTSGFEQQVAHSLEFGFSLGQIQHWSASRRFGVNASLGLSWNRYQTKHGDVFQLDDNGNTICTPWEDAPKSYTRARLTYVSWRVPVMLQFKDSDLKSCFSVGVEGELRHHVRSRVRMGSKKQYELHRHDLAVNPWGLNLVARYDFHDVGFFGRYSLTPFFDKDKTALEGTPFAFGIILTL